jgi:hypothetical protein
VQRHGIGRPLHPSQLGSTPHDDITIPQIRSSHSLPLNRPRQSASRHPPVVTNRPTTYRVRRDPPLIQQPFHHPPACWSASTPFTHLIRGAQIPIAQAAAPTSPSLGFLPWRFAYAGPRCTPRHRHGAAIRKPSQKRPNAEIETGRPRPTGHGVDLRNRFINAYVHQCVRLNRRRLGQCPPPRLA